MKAGLLLLCFQASLFVPLGAPAAAQSKGLPAFEFRGFHAREPYVEGDDRFIRCVPLATGTACALRDSVMAGVSVHQVGVAYGPGGLYALEVKFPGDKKEVVEAALRAKYGAPCKTSTEKPFNVFGVRFDRLILTWCFREGSATFKSITDSVSVGSFEFATDDAAREAAADDF